MNKNRFALELDEALDKDTQDIDKAAIKKFVKGALDRKTDSMVENLIWQDEDPDDSLTNYNMRLKFNKYQIGLLRHVARIEKRSLTNMVKVALFAELLKRSKL